MIKELNEHYGHIFERALLDEIVQVGTFKEVPAGFTLLEIGEYIRFMPLLISGAIKILREDKNGDELLLYYLEKGETCSITVNCCIGQASSEVRAIAETDTRMIMVPIRKIDEWSTRYRSWRQFIFNSYHERLTEVLQTLDSVAFDRLDERLVHYLQEKARINESLTLHSTHQEIAYDLHSSRVVISRLLKKLEKLGDIELHRNYLVLQGSLRDSVDFDSETIPPK